MTEINLSETAEEQWEVLSPQAREDLLIMFEVEIEAAFNRELPR